MSRVFRKSIVSILAFFAFVAVLWIIDALRGESPSPPKYVIIQNPLLLAFGAWWLGWSAANLADKMLGLKWNERESLIPLYVSFACGVAALLAAHAGFFAGYPPDYSCFLDNDLSDRWPDPSRLRP